MWRPVLRGIIGSLWQHDQLQWSATLRTTALLVLVLCLATGLSQARAGEPETIAINAAAAALDNAFERQSAEAAHDDRGPYCGDALL